MIDRQVAWSDERLRDLVARCVPAADEVYRLQNGDDAESALFQRFCDEGHYQRPGRTRQGIYVVTPNGKLLASTNNRNPRRVARMIREGLAAWDAMAPDARRLDAADRDALEQVWRWEREFPRDGLVLEVVSRDLPRPEQETESRPHRRGRRWRRWTDHAWNRDWAWFTAEEAASIVPGTREVGARRDVPQRLVERIARFHLVDNVRGQTDTYARQHLEGVRLTAEIAAIDGARTTLRLHGESAAYVTGGDHPRSLTTDLEGRAVWDADRSAFASFELVAVGERTGWTRFNERQRDPGPAPIGFVLRMPEGATVPAVAPAAIWNYGWPRR